MECKGRIISISQDLKGGYVLTTHLNGVNRETLATLEQDKDYRIKIVKWKEKRSLDANAYFHVLVHKIGKATKQPDGIIKNKLIRDYGAWEYIGDNIPTYSVDADFVEDMLNNPDIHFVKIGMDGERVKLALKRGSHTYDTKEMSHLIEGTIQEAKALGIETIPPEELERMINGV